MLNRRRLSMCLLAPWCLLVAGCVAKSATENGVEFGFESWVPIGVLVAGLVFIPIGFALRRRSIYASWALMIGGPIFGLWAGFVCTERYVVHDNGFEIRTGIGELSSIKKVDFAKVISCRISTDLARGRGEIEVLNFELMGSSPVRIPLNNDLKIEAGKEIVRRAAKQGIPFPGLR
jgi:hypothetical protein